MPPETGSNDIACRMRFDGRAAQEILATEPSYIQDIGLARHLSPTRSNGVAAMLAFIRETAQAQLQRDPS